jgi:hypothetical protein
MTTKTKSRYLIGALCLTALSALTGPASAQTQIEAYREPYREDHRDPRWDEDRTPSDGRFLEGGCVGGARCGGSRSEIRIPLDSSRVREIQFQAHDNVGDQSRGHLRVLIDDRVLEQDLDVAKNGGSYTVDARGIRGRYLVIQPVVDDEVVVENIWIDYSRRRSAR